ncbi:uncharacterized protein [Pleurodeles waltl]|uniref:uncharacterized protein isoform X1 n=1 Tax=Pleurodeles waltl TaxID=8319 RepID=UPI0037098B98
MEPESSLKQQSSLEIPVYEELTGCGVSGVSAGPRGKRVETEENRYGPCGKRVETEENRYGADPESVSPPVLQTPLLTHHPWAQTELCTGVCALLQLVALCASL